MMLSTLRFFFASLGAFILVGQLQAVSFRTVAVTNDSVAQQPGLFEFALETAEYDSFTNGRVSLNNSGQVAFQATIAGPEIALDNTSGIWSEGTGELAMVTRYGYQAPSTTLGTGFGIFEGLSLNNNGETAFRTVLSGDDVDVDNGLGIWSQNEGSLNKVVRAGENAPGTPGDVTFRGIVEGFGVTFHIYLPVFNDLGQTAFRADLEVPGLPADNETGIWSEGNGSLQLIARRGSQAPGTAIGVNFNTLSNPTLNSNGQAAFASTLTGTGVVDDVNDSGIWSSGPVSNELVVRSGTQAPGTAFGVNFERFFSPRINAANDIAFNASLNGPGVTDDNDRGIWSEGSGDLPGSIGLVARTGEAAPDMPVGVDYSLFRSTAFNAQGETAFVAEIDGTGIDTTNNSGIWSEGFGPLSLVAREGDHAPGTDAGVVFADLASALRPAINATGEIAFSAQLEGVGVDASNDLGIWAQDSSGVLQLIAREGDTIAVTATGLGLIEARTIETLLFTGLGSDDDGVSDGFNDLGQIAFAARFTDGSSGVFVTRLPTVVPEPSSLACLGLLISLAACRPKR